MLLLHFHIFSRPYRRQIRFLIILPFCAPHNISYNIVLAGTESLKKKRLSSCKFITPSMFIFLRYLPSMLIFLCYLPFILSCLLFFSFTLVSLCVYSSGLFPAMLFYLNYRTVTFVNLFFFLILITSFVHWSLLHPSSSPISNTNYIFDLDYVLIVCHRLSFLSPLTFLYVLYIGVWKSKAYPVSNSELESSARSLTPAVCAC